jgi:SAM-dependent methyltransferase
MIPVQQQIQKGIVVCPETHSRLHWEGSKLVSEAGAVYPTTPGGAPVLLTDSSAADQYAAASPQMNKEYSSDGRGWNAWILKAKALLRKDYRTKESRAALEQVLSNGADDRVCLSIGGGPSRISSDVTNLNIGPFPNVDVVADAHLLPYADSSVDAVYCEAVLEHLENPGMAVAEMFRVLKPGGRVIAITPFLQRFHGYPFHFQNFTVIGHALLFRRAGFTVTESGTCVGPTYAIVSLMSAYFTQCLPKVVGWPLAAVWNVVGLCVLPLDLLINHPASSHMLASTTYIVAEKPGSSVHCCNSKSTGINHGQTVPLPAAY